MAPAGSPDYPPANRIGSRSLSENSLSNASVWAFSLVELLSVLALVALLGGWILRTETASSDRVRSTRARTELGALAAALDGYRRQYGDYPRTGTEPQPSVSDDSPLVISPTAVPARLVDALLGQRAPDMSAAQGRAMIAIERFTLVLGVTQRSDPEAPLLGNALLDPWNRPYVYRYPSAHDDPWDAPGFLLYSLGPDGEELAPSTGVVDLSDSRNRDNVYAEIE